LIEESRIRAPTPLLLRTGERLPAAWALRLTT
jgi:hypothetical protein